jgi:glycerate kinase
MADGGDGTLLALQDAIGGSLSFFEVEGPLGDPITAPVALMADGSAMVEMALASGLERVRHLAPLRASSVGTGRLIAHARALTRGPIVVGVGGSASTDGGTGAATAIGWRFLDDLGRDLAPGGGSLKDLHSIVSPEEIPTGVVGACDVMSRLTGESGAARRFAPQKGAGPHDVELLEFGLERLRQVAERDLGLDLDGFAGGGAGGGMGAGLKAFFAAELRYGFDLVADAAGLDDLLAGASLVITGEGRLDEASAAAKVPGGVADRSRAAGVPCVVVAGEVALDGHALRRAGFTAALGADSLAGGGALSDPAAAVATTAETIIGTLSLPS